MGLLLCSAAELRRLKRAVGDEGGNLAKKGSKTEFLKVRELEEDEDHFRTCKIRRGSGRPRKVGEDCAGGEGRRGLGLAFEASAPNDGIQVDEPQTPSAHHILEDFDCS